MLKNIEVEEEQGTDGIKWGLCLGGPNPDSDHYIPMPSKELAFEAKQKLSNYLNE